MCQVWHNILHVCFFCQSCFLILQVATHLPHELRQRFFQFLVGIIVFVSSSEWFGRIPLFNTSLQLLKVLIFIWVLVKLAQSVNRIILDFITVIDRMSTLGANAAATAPSMSIVNGRGHTHSWLLGLQVLEAVAACRGMDFLTGNAPKSACFLHRWLHRVVSSLNLILVWTRCYSLSQSALRIGSHIRQTIQRIVFGRWAKNRFVVYSSTALSSPIFNLIVQDWINRICWKLSCGLRQKIELFSFHIVFLSWIWVSLLLDQVFDDTSFG